MQTRPAWIGKHIQHIILRLVQPFAMLRIKYFVSFGFFPFALPVFFNSSEIVFHNSYTGT